MDRRNNFTEQQLEEVEQFASLFYNLHKIALITEIDHDLLRDDYDHKGVVWKAYMKGYLKSEAEIRQSVIDHAKSGSAPAQNLAVKFMTDAEEIEEEPI